eukprot:CAMPEP_0174912740 /NCGR_PEP_ID=MMETSP0167-20121228/79943_1 /TAXON_ID=38298 /ORGANISM="Rhodella maculata, Strain CCMP736" /LENGTH=85 /DNA_ID=CAMNT_0016157405 /DNA_START=454 /DNA_END=711 /DNA_ORIENTATION=+
MKTSGACFVETVPERTALVCNVSLAMFFFAYVLVKGGGGRAGVPERTALVCNVSLAMFFFAYVLVKGGGGRAGLLGIHGNVLSDA